MEEVMISLKTMLAGLRAIAPKASALRARQETELRSMGDRELSDLGIGASEIPYLLRDTVQDAARTAVATPPAAGVGLPREGAKRELALWQYSI
jgi:uncharacterized protein YjiS (DUF1127 family)